MNYKQTNEKAFARNVKAGKWEVVHAPNENGRALVRITYKQRGVRHYAGELVTVEIFK